MKTRPVLLAIFDGFGLNPSRAHNAWALARTPHLDHYFATYPHTALQASGRAVGLPDGQFGNSEVGHLTLGSGRVLEQDLIRIANAIYGGSIEQMPAWQSLLGGAKRVHLVGLVSDGGVHSHIEHLLGILGLLRHTDIEPVIHMITDGRDTAPRAALGFLAEVENARDVRMASDLHRLAAFLFPFLTEVDGHAGDRGLNDLDDHLSLQEGIVCFVSMRGQSATDMVLDKVPSLKLQADICSRLVSH